MITLNLFRTVTFTAAILLVLSVPVFAFEQEDFGLKTTKNLYSLCSTAEGHQEFSAASAACNSFIRGAMQYHDGISDGNTVKRLICYPEGMTVAEGKITFIQWAKKNMNNSSLMNELPVQGLVRALKGKYPCAD